MKALHYSIKHFCILVLGILLALVFVWIVRESDVSASVLSLSERAFIEKAQRDAAYKKTSGSLEVFISPQLQTYPQLFVSLFFSPSKITLIPSGIVSPYSREIVSQSADALLLLLSDFATGNVDEGIVIVPFSGDAREITVEFVSNQREEGTFFALGALDTPLEETHL